MSVPDNLLLSAVTHFREEVGVVTGKWWTLEAIHSQLYHYCDFEGLNFSVGNLRRVVLSLNATEMTVEGGNRSGFHIRRKQFKIMKRTKRYFFIYLAPDTHSDPIEDPNRFIDWKPNH